MLASTLSLLPRLPVYLGWRPSRRLSAVCFLLTCVCLAIMVPTAHASESFEERSNQGLGPNATVPAWAVGKSVYFLRRHPTPPTKGALTPNLSSPMVESHNTKGVGCEKYSGAKCEKYFAPGVSRYETGPNGEGGEVVHSPTIYLIFWVRNGKPKKLLKASKTRHGFSTPSPQLKPNTELTQLTRVFSINTTTTPVKFRPKTV